MRSPRVNLSSKTTAPPPPPARPTEDEQRDEQRENLKASPLPSSADKGRWMVFPDAIVATFKVRESRLFIVTFVDTTQFQVRANG
jgi:hypothetical protein